MSMREGCLWSRAIHHPIRPPQADLTQTSSGVVHTQCSHGGAAAVFNVSRHTPNSVISDQLWMSMGYDCHVTQIHVQLCVSLHVVFHRHL